MDSPSGGADLEIPTQSPSRVIGPLLISGLLAFFLFGVYVSQLFNYMFNISSSSRWRATQVLIAIITVIETVYLGFLVHAIWTSIIGSIQDWGALADVNPPKTSTGFAMPALNGLVACIVQLYFANKIYALAPTADLLFLSVPIGFLSLTQFGISIAIPILLSENNLTFHREETSEIGRVSISIGLHLSMTLVCDVLITIGMISVFRKFQGLTRVSATKRLLNSLVIHTIENGMVTTLCAFMGLVTFFAWPNDTFHLIFQYTIGGLYANVLLISLNRQYRTRLMISNQDITLPSVDVALDLASKDPSRTRRQRSKETPNVKSAEILNGMGIGVVSKASSIRFAMHEEEDETGESGTGYELSDLGAEKERGKALGGSAEPSSCSGDSDHWKRT